MEFERGLDPKESMGIGIDALLKQLGIKFVHTQNGDPIFVKEEDGSILLRPLEWDSKQLRAIADYLDAHPEANKVIEIIEDDRPKRWKGALNPSTPQLPALDLDDDLGPLMKALKKK